MYFSLSYTLQRKFRIQPEALKLKFGLNLGLTSESEGFGPRLKGLPSTFWNTVTPSVEHQIEREAAYISKFDRLAKRSMLIMTCAICPKHTDVEIHFAYAKTNSSDSALVNVRIPLCRKHHGLAHRGKFKSRETTR